jgi:hypothetical protein
MALKRSSLFILAMLYCCYGLYSKDGFAANQNKQFDSTYWENLVKDKQFNEDEFTPQKQKLPKKKLQTDLNIPKPVKYAIFGIALLVLLFALYFVIKMIRAGRGEDSKKKSIESITLENISLIDPYVFEKEIQSSLEKGDFRLAFRWRFLQLLKLLEEKNLIRYSLDKTNQNYLEELKDRALIHKAFAALCANFDPIWYGHKMIGEKVYFDLDGFFKICKHELDLI